VKRFDDFTAVADLSFDCAPGEILGLVGPNGAGKTTTLRCIAGILKPTHGRVAVCGQDMARHATNAKRALAFIPDTPHPFDMLTVREHLHFIALAYDMAVPAGRIDALLEEFELTAKRDALASTLSRGMCQKLAIAAAFLHEPQVILFDEPLTGLDPKAIRLMRDAIRRRAAEGATVLISSHLLDLGERICDRVLVLHRGRRLAIGTMEAIRAAAAARQDASLEEAFFAITEETDAA